MLKIHVIGYEDNCIRDIDGYFWMHKEKDWFNDPVVKKIIKDIDNTIAVKDEYLESPVFGGISPESLSGGCKAVILLAVLDNPNIFASRCGDNCVPSILEVAKNKDVAITLHHCMHFPKDGWEACFAETGTVVHSRKEFVHEFYRINHSFQQI